MHTTDEELGSQHSSEADEQTEREEDSQTEDEGDSQAEEASKTVNMDEVIEQFSSSEPDTDPPLPKRKRGGRVEEHVKKKSRIEENPLKPFHSRLSHLTYEV